MRFFSVCSGIEAASVAWTPLGWTPIAFCEIAPFPSKVLAYRYGSNLPGEPPLANNGVPNLGDFTQIEATDLGMIDVFVGGTPCQPFSSIGKGSGLQDELGMLSLHFADMAHELARHNGLRFAIWENVPRVLARSKDFGRILGHFVGSDAPLDLPKKRRRWPNAGMVAGDGVRVAWRVLDAQYFGLPQRRKRLFVVVGFGDDADPTEILFEQTGLSGHTQTRGGQKEAVSASSDDSPGGGGDVNEAEEAQSVICFDPRKSDPLLYGRISGPLDCGIPGPAIAYPDSNNVEKPWLIRVLLPEESEAVQGLPAGWTNIPTATDSQRYKAIGNSMPVPVMTWLGRRITDHEARRLPQNAYFGSFCGRFSFVL